VRVVAVFPISVARLPLIRVPAAPAGARFSPASMALSFFFFFFPRYPCDEEIVFFASLHVSPPPDVEAP